MTVAEHYARRPGPRRGDSGPRRTNNQLAVKLTPVEQERLWIFLAAELARKRRAAGLRLNHPEAVALITDEVIEAARAGRSYDEARHVGHAALSEDDVIDGVEELVDFVQIEALFEEGTQLVTLWFPVKNAAGPPT
jgi:urease subunit gamma/beta